MPLYDFHCPSCEARFEAMKPMAERHEPPACPSCGANSELQLSASAVLTGGPACHGNMGACPAGAPFAAPPCCGGGGQGKCPI